MAKELKKEYWMCIIGSTTRDRLPDGADFPMRMRVRDTFTELTGRQDEHCWSGWGLTDKKRELIMKIWNMDESDLPNEICPRNVSDALILTPKDAEIFFNEIMNPEEANEALKKAMLKFINY